MGDKLKLILKYCKIKPLEYKFITNGANKKILDIIVNKYYEEAMLIQQFRKIKYKEM